MNTGTARYLVIDMTAELEVELAVPVGAPAAASGRVRPGVLPEGRYAVLRHTGPYDGLHYLTDPSKEPGPARWEVDVASLMREA